VLRCVSRFRGYTTIGYNIAKKILTLDRGGELVMVSGTKSVALHFLFCTVVVLVREKRPQLFLFTSKATAATDELAQQWPALSCESITARL
jgi:hypothetical protein